MQARMRLKMLLKREKSFEVSAADEKTESRTYGIMDHYIPKSIVHEVYGAILLSSMS